MSKPRSITIDIDEHPRQSRIESVSAYFADTGVDVARMQRDAHGWYVEFFTDADRDWDGSFEHAPSFYVEFNDPKQHGRSLWAQARRLFDCYVASYGEAK